MRAARRCTLALAALASIAVIGCGRQASPGRPEILYGEHECDHCRMIVSEARFAAVAVLNGETARFDDLGCLARWASGKDLAGAAIWVHDFAEPDWLEESGAAFVRSSEVVTPMGSGWLAFGDPAAAARLAGQLESPLDWTEFRKRSEENESVASRGESQIE